MPDPNTTANWYSNGSTFQTGVGTNAHLLNAYSQSQGLTNHQYFAQNGITAGGGSQGIGAVWNNVNNDPALANKLLAATGYSSFDELKNFLTNTKATPGTGDGSPTGAALTALGAQQDANKANNLPTATQSPGVDTNYQMKPGETVAQYQTRTQQYNASKGDYQPAGQTNLTSFAPIGSASLASSSAPSYTSAPPLPQTGYGGPAPTVGALQETPQQTQLDRQMSDLMALNTTEAGKAGYQTDQNNAQGIDTKTQLVNDLAAKLQSSQEAAVNIQAAPQTGEGVTSAVDQRQRAEQLRLNTVTSLEYNAQLQAARGNLSTAQDLADKAVKAKYDPIEAQITAAQQNIQLFMQSPNYTTAEKNAAQAASDRLDAQKAAIAQQKADAQDVFKVYADSAQNIANFTPSPQYGTVQAALDAISKATTPMQAEQIAAATGLTQAGAKNGTWSTPYMLGGSYVQKNDLTGEVRQAVNPPNAPAGGGGNTLTNAGIQNGAANAGLNMADFKGLPIDVQNYYNQLSSANATAINTLIQQANSGQADPVAVKKQIDDSNAPPAAKTYLDSLIKPQAKSASGGGGLQAVADWFGAAWNKLTGS